MASIVPLMSPFSVYEFGDALETVLLLLWPNDSYPFGGASLSTLIIRGAIVSACVDARKLELKLVPSTGRISNRPRDGKHDAIETKK